MMIEAIKATSQSAAPAAAAGGAGGATATPPVIIEIDGREIGKIVEKYIAKQNSLPARVKSGN